LQVLEDKGAPLADLVTHRFALEDIDEAFATASDKQSRAIRVVVGG
jgi:threonine dehydrogenase-like Zn-dependent dehydrogenase